MLKLANLGKLLFTAVMGVGALTACVQNEIPAKQIVPTTGEFSDDEEAFYLKRFEDLVKAFSTGADTTVYDTEVTFGDNLTEKALKRGRPVKLSDEVLVDLINYAEAAGSDSFLIYESGNVVSEHYFDDVEKQSFINSKSLAKPLGVIAVGRAIEQGYIKSLDQSVADFIVEWQGTDKANITIEHILSMRTGLLPQGPAFTADHILNRAYLHPRHIEVIILSLIHI